MKQNITRIAALLLVCLCLFMTVGCQIGDSTTTEGTTNGVATGLWANAIYTEDTTLGEGANTITVLVTAEDKTVTFTIQTDAATLGEALYALELINDPSFFDTCNGMVADWSRDNAYWCCYADGVTMNHGVADEEIAAGNTSVYELIYTKL